MGEMKRYYSFFTSHPGDWRPCSKEHHDMVRANPQDWPGYEVRELAVIPAGHVVVSEGLLRSALTHAHNRGYLAGHHDTVEAQFSHILSSELDSYRSEQVEDILQALLGEGKEHE